MAVAERNAFAGDGEMAALMQGRDWAATPLGPVSGWPPSLLNAVNLILESRYPMMVLWGPAFIQFYNDAYRPILGASKHPGTLGASCPDSGVDAWEVIGPLVQRVRDTGDAVWHDDLLLEVDRNGYLEETHFAFSYSPIRDEDGDVGGVLVTGAETTAEVVSERRLRTLRELAARTVTDRAADACAIAAGVLADNPADVPFALVYLLDADGCRARLAGAAGLPSGSAASPVVVELGEPNGVEPIWSLQAAVETDVAIDVTDPAARFGDLPGGPWPESPHVAVVTALRQADGRPVGLLVAGVSPRLALDDAYRGFLDLVADQVATAIVNARTLEGERDRAESLAALDRANTALLNIDNHEFRMPEAALPEPAEKHRTLFETMGQDFHPRDGDRLAVFDEDLTQRRRAEAELRASEERQAFLLTLSDGLRPLTDPSAIQAEASRLVGERLRVDRTYYVEIDDERGLALVGRDYVRGEAPSLAGSHPLASFAAVLDPLQTGRPFVASDAVTDPRISDADRSAFLDRALRAFIAIPVRKEGRLVGALCVAGAQPREWTVDDIGLLQDVAERTWDAVERARAEAALRESTAQLASELAAANQLQAVSSQLIQEDDIDLLYAQIVDAAIALTHADFGSMQMVVPERNELLLLAEKGFTPDAATFWHWVRVDSESSCGEALAAGQRVIVPDVETCAFMAGTDDLDQYRAAGMRAVQSTPLVARNGRIVGMLSTHWRDVHQPADRELRLIDVLARQAADLIERRRADDAVRQSEQRLQKAIEIETVGVIYFRTDGAITYANDAFLHMSGYSRDDVARGLVRWDTMTPPEWMPATLHAMDELVASGRIYPYEKEYIRKDGSRWWTLCAGTRLSEDEGVKFVLDVTEARQLEAAHAAALDAIAHDVKNPLTTVVGQAQLIGRDLARETIDRERVQQRAAAIAAGARRATDLIDDLTDAARLRAGQPLTLQPAPVDLVPLVEAAAAAQQSATDRHTIEVEATEASLVGVLDGARIRRVLDNLLGNAVKYSPNGGPVTIRVRRAVAPDGVWAEVAVVDRGVGIPAGDLPRVFEAFHRGGNVAQRIAGSGIGLSGARQIVEQHGGTIVATSAEGAGSVFTVRLPLAPDES